MSTVKWARRASVPFEAMMKNLMATNMANN